MSYLSRLLTRRTFPSLWVNRGSHVLDTDPPSIPVTLRNSESDLVVAESGTQNAMLVILVGERCKDSSSAPDIKMAVWS